MQSGNNTTGEKTTAKKKSNLKRMLNLVMILKYKEGHHLKM